MAKEIVCEINQDELACRLLEALFGVERPPELTARESLDNLSERIRTKALDGSKAAMDYFYEQLRGAVEQSKVVQ